MRKFSQPDIRIRLYRRFKWFENRVVDVAKKSKYSFLTISQIRVFGSLQGGEMNISELAKIMNISRQAVQKTISILLDRDLVKLTVARNNLSSKLINVTAEGRKIQTWSKRVIIKAEKELATKIGQEKVKLLKEILQDNWD